MNTAPHACVQYMKVSIKVKAGSRLNKVSLETDQIVIRIKAPAQEGRANEELIAFLSELLEIPKSHITIAGGHNSPFKRVDLPDEAIRKLRKVALDQSGL